MERNTTLEGFSCINNPGSVLSNGEYNPKSPAEQRMKQAMIATKAAVETWNRKNLPVEIVLARHSRKQDLGAAAAAVKTLEKKRLKVVTDDSLASLSLQVDKSLTSRLQLDESRKKLKLVFEKSRKSTR